MKALMDKLYANNAKGLRRMVNKIVSGFGGITQKDMDDFYSVADFVITKINNDIENNAENHYDPSKGKLEPYVRCAVEYRIKDALSHRNAKKRNPHDAEGNIMQVLSLDSPMGEDNASTIGEFLCDKASDFDIISAIDEKNGNVYSENVEIYLNSITKTQRKIVELKMDGFTVDEIRDRLGLTKKQYEQEFKALRRNSAVSLLNKNLGVQTTIKTEGKTMKPKKSMREHIDYDDVLDIDTTSDYRMDKYSVKSLLDDKAGGEINCKYISQRQPFVWSDEQVNKFYSRILNNQPIPEIVICETNGEEDKVAYLIDGLQRLSYLEEFRENRISIGLKGAEKTFVKYRKYITDENGKRIFDEDGRPQFTIEIFDIVGKTYRDLPEFLQKRFDNFNINVTRYFNCTPDIIDYHIRNYNSHTSMTTSQYGVTTISNATTKNIKTLSEKHEFFKECIKCTDKNRKKGAVEEMVARTIMATFFIDDWKKQLLDALKYIDSNVSEKQFDHLQDNLDRLIKVVNDKEIREMFNKGNTHIWLAVFDKFENLGIPDQRFIDFMKEFNVTLHKKVVDGMSYDEFCKQKRQTTDKTVVRGKINRLVALMYEYLHINTDGMTLDVISYIQENIKADVNADDVELYSLILDDLAVEVDSSSKLLDDNNKPSMTVLVAYGCEQDIDLKDWMIDYFKRNNTYLNNQTENYLAMKNDVDIFYGIGA